MPYPIARRTIIPLLARRIRVEGLELLPSQGPYIIAANHQSYLDPPQLAFPLIVKRDIKIWFLTGERIWRAFRKIGGSGLMRWLGMVPIREAKKSDSLAAAIDILEHGGIVAIFPEGGRNLPVKNPDWQTTLMHGKTGTVRLALAVGAPIVPVGIISPKGVTAGQAIKNFFSNAEPAVIRFGPPIVWPKMDVATMTKDDLNAKTREIMIAIGKLCGKMYRD